MATTSHRLAEAVARLDALQREQLDWIEVLSGEGGGLRVVLHPHPYCGESFGGALASLPAVDWQVAELVDSGMFGTVGVDETSQGAQRLRLWATPKERRAWEARIQLALTHPEAAGLLRAAGELKAANWRRERAIGALHEAVWAADAALADTAGASATDLIDTAQVSRATFYKFVQDRPRDWTPPPIPELVTDPATPAAEPPAAAHLDETPGGVEQAATTTAAPSAPRKQSSAGTQRKPRGAAQGRAGAGEQDRAVRSQQARLQRSAGGEVLPASEGEIARAQEFAEKRDESWSTARARDAVARWHEVTGNLVWSGTHIVIRTLMAHAGDWPGAKLPQSADLGLFHELRESDDFWGQRAWILTPGEPAQDSVVLGCDVNAQYVAAAASVELGEGNPEHWTPEEQLPDTVLKTPGWVRLGGTVTNAPWGLDLPEALWIPTSLADYLHRSHHLELDLAEALIWPTKRRALSGFATKFTDWSRLLKSGTTQADHDALAMAKGVYTRMLGGYLTPREDGMVRPEWDRPDWAMLLIAQADANLLRALDKLPTGCVARAKFRDAAYIEQTAGASLTAWANLDPVKSGKFKFLGDPVPGGWFADCTTATDWQKTYAQGA